MKVLWDTGEEDWQPLNKIKADDPITLAKYVEAKGLVDKPYWKWANRYIKNKRSLRLCRQVFLARKKTGPVYKLGVQVPRTTKEALLLEEQSNSNLWKDAIAKEMTKIAEFQVFKTPFRWEPTIRI